MTNNDWVSTEMNFGPDAWDDSTILDIFDDAIRSHKTKKDKVSFSSVVSFSSPTPCIANPLHYMYGIETSTKQLKCRCDQISILWSERPLDLDFGKRERWDV
jgi:hypothetical protein